MLQRFVVVAGVFLVLAGPSFAAPVAIRAKQLLDVKSGTLIENAVVLVDGERITAILSDLLAPLLALRSAPC